MSIFSPRKDLSALTKEIVPLKEMCCCNRGEERERGEEKNSEIGELPFRHCSLRLSLMCKAGKLLAGVHHRVVNAKRLGN